MFGVIEGVSGGVEEEVREGWEGGRGRVVSAMCVYHLPSLVRVFGRS